jgi:outer membrane protein TolC
MQWNLCNVLNELSSSTIACMLAYNSLDTYLSLTYYSPTRTNTTTKAKAPAVVSAAVPETLLKRRKTAEKNAAKREAETKTRRVVRNHFFFRIAIFVALK